jgi:hypothetical protein
MSSNGQRKPRPDVNLLTPNDYRRLRVRLGGRDPDELLGGGVTEDVIQTLMLAVKLREDSSFTWEAAGDIGPAEVFDMSAGEDREPDPPTAPPGSPGPEAAPKPASGSRGKRASSAPAPSSATSTP